MTVTRRTDQIYPELVKLRRDLHRYPETGFEEFRTTEKIIRFLKDYGISNIQRPLSTGLIADIIHRKDAGFIALRADIDALPITDLKTVTYHSRNKGICHACGHDIHTAVVSGVGAVSRPADISLQHNIRLIFQPAEEPIPSGAPRMIAENVLENVETVWAMHVDPALPLGTVSLTSGWVNAQSIRLHWNIKGKGGHSARPHLAKNPIIPGTMIIERVNNFVNHQKESLPVPFAFSFTQFLSGSAYNAIPDRAEILGTLRITDIETTKIFYAGFKDINRYIEKESGVSIDFTVQSGSPPVINDTEIISRFSKTDLHEFGIRVKQENNYRSMGGDDFGWYLQKVPGAMIRFGTAESSKAPALHTGLFDAPEQVIDFAVLFFAHQILNWSEKATSRT
jgi:amidohydrolase